MFKKLNQRKFRFSTLGVANLTLFVFLIGVAFSPFAGTCGGGLNPMVCQDQTAGVYGPGSPSTVVDDAGTRYLIYRIKTTAAESWSDRRTQVDLLYRNELDQLVITPTIHTANPVPVF